MYRTFSVAATLLLVCLSVSTAEADHVSQQKRGNHLFKPTPVDQMREFATDRPDKTESAYTIDAGHFQFETDVFTYTHDVDRFGNATESTVFNFVNAKVGLLNDLDVHVIVQSFTATSIKPHGMARQNVRGFGDITLRLKYNIIGNDAGIFALSCLPFVTIPTGVSSADARMEFGAAFPMAISLPKDFGLGAMVQLTRGDTADLLGTIVLGHDLWGDFGGYVEFFGQRSFERGAPFVATVDGGITYAATPNWQLDAGVNVGVTEAADDINPFMGLSGRF